MKTLLTLLAVAMLAGCPSEDRVHQDIAELCGRADDCNVLSGSVDECIASRQRCVDNLPASYQQDWADMIEGCLGYDSCPLAYDCYLQVPWC